MLALVAAAALALQVQAGKDTAGKKNVNISVGVGAGAANRRGEPRRIPVTPELLRTAFRDSAARALLLRARAARMRQDSGLVAYDAMSYQRISAGLGIGSLGRDRLMFRHEDAAHVRWQRGVGAWVEMKGARTAIPIAPQEAQDSADADMSTDDGAAIPYYPGYESLWIGGGVAKAQVDEREIVHPLAEGAEAYYTYATGDSVRFRMPDGTVIALRELQVRPRRPEWNLVVGSLWFDVSTGQLVRAAFRLSVPMDIWAVAERDDPHSMDDVPFWVKPMISPMKAQVTAVAIEYGLYNGRFWLPRLQSAEGDAQVSFMHVPFSMEQSYKYASVNGRDSLPPITVAVHPIPDSLPTAVKDSLRDQRRTARRAERDSVREGLKPPPTAVCDTARFYTRMSYRYNDARLPIAYQVPCDRSALATSPLLPKSIFDPGEEIFGSPERDALVAEALSLSAQAQFAPMPPTFHWGADLMRFNRVEGFSMGVAGGRTVRRRLYGVAARADRRGRPRAERRTERGRSNGTRTVGITGYNRLVSAGDWGEPAELRQFAVGAAVRARRRVLLPRLGGGTRRHGTPAGRTTTGGCSPSRSAVRR